MNGIRVCRTFFVALIVTTSLPGMLPLGAQSASESGKVIVINREMTKPGRDGMPHEETEAGFVHAVQANKANIHYVAWTSVTGMNRALFISAYPSIEAMDQERRGLSAAARTAMDKAMVADGEHLSETTTSVWLRRDDLSSNVAGPPTGTRLLEVSEFIAKPGHEREFEELAKMYVDAAKGIPEMHWTMYEMAYGKAPGSPGGGIFLVLTAFKSGAEADAGFAAGSRFDQALGESGRKKMAELASSSIESQASNLFAISPKMSLPTDDMIKAEPDFWKQKAMGSSAAKKPAAAAKPSAASGQ